MAEVGSLDEPGKPGKVVATVHSATVFAGGYLLYLRDNTLMAQSFDPNRLETKGEALPLAENVPVFTNASRIPGFAVSRGGLLVYLSGGQAGETALVWRDRQGKPAGNLGERSGAVVGVSISPDGKSVAAGIGRDSANYDIWIYDVARGVRSRFTANSGNNILPIWAPDGKQIYFSSSGGPSVLYVKAANGAGSEEIILALPAGSFPSPESISPDGKRLLFGQSGEKTGRDLWVLPIGEGNISGKSEPRAFLQTSFNEAFGRFSSDGTWVAYASDESGKYQVYAAPFPGPGGKRQISPGTGRQPVWRKDGKELFYVTAEGHMMAVEVAIRGDALEVGRVQKLFEGVAVSGSANFDVTADGQKFLMKEGSQSAAHPMTLLQNWTAALRK